MQQHTKQLVIVDAGTSDPSTTRMLSDKTAARVMEVAKQRGVTVTAKVVSLKPLANDIATALTTGLLTPELERASETLRTADGIIASTPIYKAGPSALFTGFFQVLDNDLLIGKPVILAATAGTARHALVVADQVRPLFAYLRTLTVPTALFATAEDWSSPDMTTRIDRAATELALLIEAGFAEGVRDTSWQSYQHSYGSAGGTELGIDLSSDLMKLATGGGSAQ